MIEFHANKKQKEAFAYLFDGIHTDIGYGGGAGGGKSYLGSAWLWMQCIKNPWVRYGMGRKELKRLKQTTLISYFKFLNDYNIPESQRWVYNAQDGVIKFANKSEIILLNCAWEPSDPLYQRMGSLELTGCFLDEAAEIDEACINILNTRIGRCNNEKFNLKPKMLQTFNPDKGHVYRNFYKANKDDTLPEYRVFIAALVTDNEFISPDYIEQLRKSDKITRERLLYGNFDYSDTPWKIFEYDKILDIFTNPKQNGKKYISADIARKGKDKCVILVWDGFEVIDSVIYDKSDNQMVQNKIKELAQRHLISMSQVIVDEDGVGGGVVDNLHCKGFVNNSKALDPYGAKANQFLKRNYVNLKTQCYFEFAKYVNEWKVRWDIDGKVKQYLAEELDIVVQVDIDKDSKIKIISKEEIKEKLARSPDYSDAMMMRFYFELKKVPDSKWTYKYQDPESFGLDQLDEWDRMEKENNEREIGKIQNNNWLQEGNDGLFQRFPID